MKLLLLSDNTMDVNDKGFPQTLYNVFCFVPPKDMLCITSSKAYRKNKPSVPFTSRYQTYNFTFAGLPVNRLTRRLKKIENWLNYSINNYFRSFKKVTSAIKNFAPDVVIVATNGAESVFMYRKLKSSFSAAKCFPYFMDDWMVHQRVKWLGGGIRHSVKKLLNENRAWLMISKNLADILSERYNTKPARLLEIHNPVDIKEEPGLPDFTGKDAYTFAYAGSLWPMHFDALLVICKAINRLQNTRNIKLVIYTTEAHWNWRKNELNYKAVEYGGNIPYSKIHSTLSGADCLIVTASFQEKWFTHTKGSVQTKLTDYMKATRLIIACGPAYAANNDFIKQYDCGICIETKDEDAVAKQLGNILDSMVANQRYILNAFNALKENFTFEKVHQKLKDFLVA